MTKEKSRNSFGKIGAICTGIYICILIFFVIYYWQHFSPMKPNEWGDFFAGTLGPVALIWVVLGFFLQGRELGHSVKALNLQAKELQNSVEQQRAMVNLTREQIDFNITTKQQQEKLAADKNLPDISIKLDEYKNRMLDMSKDLLIRNLGAAATSVEAILQTKNKYVGSFDIGLLGHNETKNLGQRASFTDGPYKLKIASRSISGLTRVQEFSVNYSGTHKLSCAPKRFQGDDSHS